MSKKKYLICPSVLAADFAHLGTDVQRAENAGADALHIDIMDGQFVPNISIGPQVVSAINRSTNLPLHVHLMIYNPFDYIEQFVKSGADQISFHLEATEDVQETLQFIRTCGIKASIAINPETSVSLLPPYFPYVDEILIMSVHPGFGGQKFIPDTVEKIREIATYVQTSQYSNIHISVDGGINNEKACMCVQAGADVIISGTYLFGAANMGQAIHTMRQSLNKVK